MMFSLSADTKAFYFPYCFRPILCSDDVTRSQGPPIDSRSPYIYNAEETLSRSYRFRFGFIWLDKKWSLCTFRERFTQISLFYENFEGPLKILDCWFRFLWILRRVPRFSYIRWVHPYLTKNRTTQFLKISKSFVFDLGNWKI